MLKPAKLATMVAQLNVVATSPWATGPNHRAEANVATTAKICARILETANFEIKERFNDTSLLYYFLGFDN